MKSVHIRSCSGPHLDRIRRDTEYSVRVQENTDQNNSEYGHVLRGEDPTVNTNYIDNPVLNATEKYKNHPSIKRIKTNNKNKIVSFRFQEIQAIETEKELKNLDCSKASQYSDIPAKIIKVGFSPSKKYIVICFIESALKMMKKNAFYFILKALFVLKIFIFLS